MKKLLNLIKKNKLLSIILFFVFTIFIILPIIFYLMNVKFDFDKNSSSWGSFGNYLSGTLGIGIYLIIYIITVFILIRNYLILNEQVSQMKEQVKLMKEEQTKNEDFLKAEIFDKFAEKYITVEFENYIKLLLNMRKNLDSFVEKSKNYTKVNVVSNPNQQAKQIAINNEIDKIQNDLGIKNIDSKDLNNLKNLTKENIIIPYLKVLYKQQPNKEFLELDKARRQVSNFFQRMGILYNTNNLDSRHLTKFWDNFHAENIIYNIIIPMEDYYKTDDRIPNVKYLKIIAEIFQKGDTE